MSRFLEWNWNFFFFFKKLTQRIECVIQEKSENHIDTSWDTGIECYFVCDNYVWYLITFQEIKNQDYTK